MSSKCEIVVQLIFPSALAAWPSATGGREMSD